MRVLTNFYLLITFLFLTSTSDAEDWPRWRGPTANGISVESGWNPAAITTSPEKLWELNVGVGHSSFSIRGKYLYTMGNIDSKDIIYCLDAVSGKENWRFTYDCDAGNYAGPRATPTLDGEFLYTLSREGHLFCFNALTGKVIWKKQIVDEFGAVSPTWGFASSPYIVDDMLVLNACKNGLVLNKKTGDKIWASDPGISGYASPSIISLQGKRYGIFFGEKNVYGVELDTGKEQWSYSWETENDVNATDPLVIDNQIFITSGYKTGCALLDISGKTAKEVWKNKNMSNQFGGGVYLEGFIYGSDGQVGKRRSKIICIDITTGENVWSEAIGFNSLTLADKKLIILNEKGKLIIATATNTGYKELATAQVLPKDIRCWAAPILANGKIYCRNTNGDLVCINVTI
jgi:outer membrane protein assembly factor BamB